MNTVKKVWNDYCESRSATKTREDIDAVKAITVNTIERFQVIGSISESEEFWLDVVEIKLSRNNETHSLIKTDFIDSWMDKGERRYSINGAWLMNVDKDEMFKRLEGPIPLSETGSMEFKNENPLDAFLGLFGLRVDFERVLSTFYANGGTQDYLYEVEHLFLDDHFGMYHLYMDALNHIADNSKIK
jgi:hypothetical protein